MNRFLNIGQSFQSLKLFGGWISCDFKAFSAALIRLDPSLHSCHHNISETTHIHGNSSASTLTNPKCKSFQIDNSPDREAHRVGTIRHNLVEREMLGKKTDHRIYLIVIKLCQRGQVCISLLNNNSTSLLVKPKVNEQSIECNSLSHGGTRQNFFSFFHSQSKRQDKERVRQEFFLPKNPVREIEDVVLAKGCFPAIVW